MAFISYAQNYEDVILWRALRDVDHGFYVDVGAADPQVDSVSCAFYERGWSGINIEPLDEHFAKLTQARPRDINLKVAVGKEAGLRTFHAIGGTGLSTLDPQVAARQQAAGWKVDDTVEPVLTLAKIFENCAPETVHFLKIDVEGDEAEVLEGLNLERVRPWIIVIEATAPSFVGEGTVPGSQVITRHDWEHLIINRGYFFAYFDGLNCFYVADEVAALKERLAVPPNVFDDFVRFPEWACRQEAADLRNHSSRLEAMLRAEQAETADLRNATRVAQEQLRALQAERAQKTSLHLRLDDLSARIHHLSTQLAMPSFDRAIGCALKCVHETGNRLTGGGLRSLARRVLSTSVRRATANGDQLATEPDAVAASSIPSPGESLPSDDDAVMAALPASARPIYARLKTAISDDEVWRRTQ